MSSTGQYDIQPNLPIPLPSAPVESLAPAWEMIEPHMGLVRQIAFRIRRRLPGSVEIDDLEQAGVIGLMAGLSSAESAGRQCSEAYLRLRIQGAILDSLREYDWASRYMRDRGRKLRDAEAQLRQSLGREPGSEEVAEHLDLDLQSFFELTACTQPPSIVDCGTTKDGDAVTIEEFIEDPNDIPQDRACENQELRRMMLMGAASLSAEHCVVLLLYYFAEWSGAQIARVLQLSEARVSQLRTSALAALRRKGQYHSALRPSPGRKNISAPDSPYRSDRDSAASLVRALSETLAICEPQAWEHCVRVEAYTAHLAARLGYPENDIPRLLDAALLHDLGTICVPAGVLHKPGSLDQEEWQSVRSHVLVACAILSRVSALSGLTEIVRHHHENFFGGGYPDGISGNSISPAARIIALTDTLDALTSERSYREALDFSEATRRIRQQAHPRFDPAVLKVFFEVEAKEWERIRASLSAPAAFKPAEPKIIQ